MSERLRHVDVRWLVPRLVAGCVIAFALLYVLVITSPAQGEFGEGNWRTTNTGSAIDDPGAFIATVLDGLTFAGLLFIVASGFSLIFGLMRVVNMAHGSFYLLGGYIAYEVQQRMTGSGLSIRPNEVNTLEWVVPWLVAMLFIGIFGLAVQQLLLRWNQGQDLRQALITIAVSVIIADQVIAHFPRTVPLGTQKFGGNAVSLTWPGWTSRLVDLHVAGVSYSLARFTMLGAGDRGRHRAVALAAANEDRDGHPRRRRRPPDDLGAGHQHPEDVRDRVPRRLRARRLRSRRRRLAGLDRTRVVTASGCSSRSSS